jgi:hypothetical protein
MLKGGRVISRDESVLNVGSSFTDPVASQRNQLVEDQLVIFDEEQTLHPDVGPNK